MSHFDPVVSLNGLTDKEIKAVIKKYGHRASLKAMWSWNGELIDVDDLDEINRLNEDEQYTEHKLMNSNLRV